MSKFTTLTFPLASLRKIENPQKDSEARDYIAVVNIKDLPKELNDWRDINVRDAKLNSNVAKGIRETLENAPDTFFFKNRGITIVAAKIGFDSGKSILEISFDENERDHQGLLDGGHTFSVIRAYLEETKQPSEAYVRVEIIEGITDENDIVGIVEARNKSTQVQEQGIQELLHKFDPIKDILADQSYKENIAYKEYELSDDGSKKTIDIKDILSYLLCFYTDGFDANNHPIKAYTQKKGIVTQYAEDMDDKKGKKTFKKFLPLLPKILTLRDIINRDFKNTYNSVNRKFASLEGAKNDSISTLEFLGEEVDYRLPIAYVYPLLAAFRSCVQCEGNKCEWAVDPIELWERIRDTLISRLAEQATSHKNPDKFGKDSVVWGRCYDTALLEILKKRAEEAEDK